VTAVAELRSLQAGHALALVLVLVLRREPVLVMDDAAQDSTASPVSKVPLRVPRVWARVLLMGSGCLCGVSRLSSSALRPPRP
jgi:hypothetical protein